MGRGKGAIVTNSVWSERADTYAADAVFRAGNFPVQLRVENWLDELGQ